MSNPLDGRLSMDTFDGLLNTTQAAVEAMCNGSLSPRETDKNPVAAPSVKLDSSGPFGVFGVVNGGAK